MSTISMFYGIIIKMCGGSNEQGPVHFHAYFEDHKAAVDINACEIIEGELPIKQLKLVLAWAELHQDENRANWRLISENQAPFKIQPLR